MSQCLYHLIIPGILADVPSCHRDYLWLHDPAPPAGRDYVPMSATRRIIHRRDKTKNLGLRWYQRDRKRWEKNPHGQIEISTSWAPCRSQKGNNFIFLFTIEHLGALSNLTLSVRKSISYFDQNLISGTMYWPADIDVINIDEEGQYGRQSLQQIYSNFFEKCTCFHIFFTVSEAIYLCSTIE